MEVLFLIGRILYGGFFVRSGINHFRGVSGMAPYAASKGVPAPAVAVVLTGVLLFLGGASVVFGILPFWGILCLVVFLGPVTFVMHRYWDDVDPGAARQNEVQFMKNIALLGAALILWAMPQPWALALW